MHAATGSSGSGHGRDDPPRHPSIFPVPLLLPSLATLDGAESPRKVVSAQSYVSLSNSGSTQSSCIARGSVRGDQKPPSQHPVKGKSGGRRALSHNEASSSRGSHGRCPPQENKIVEAWPVSPHASSSFLVSLPSPVPVCSTGSDPRHRENRHRAPGSVRPSPDPGRRRRSPAVGSAPDRTR